MNIPFGKFRGRSLDELVGRRLLARKYHPDGDGNLATVQSVNVVAHTLLERLGGGA